MNPMRSRRAGCHWRGISGRGLLGAALALVGLLGATAAGAQEDKASTAPRVEKAEEVERGFWLRANMGFAMSVTNMFGDGRSSDPWPPGPMLQIEAGYDFGQIASIHLALHGQQVAGSDETSRGRVSNDAAMLAFLGGGRFNLITGKRLAWYLKVNVGYMLTSPELARFSSGLLVGGGTGIEYATMLRHFFVGLEVSGSYDIKNAGVLVALTPNLKYTF